MDLVGHMQLEKFGEVIAVHTHSHEKVFGNINYVGAFFPHILDTIK